jgi:tripartite-type tricarboxylate transporter receptor subunit TctC
MGDPPMKTFPLLAVAVVALMGTATDRLRAQDWPSHPVKIIVGFSPGGSADQFGRLIAQELSDTLGQQFFIEYHPGSSGTIAAGLTARATPDGYTLMVGGSGPHITSPAINPNIGYDPLKDFSHIAMIGADGFVAIGSPALGAKNLADVVRAAKSKQGPLTFSSPGPGSLGELLMLQFGRKAGIELTHVPAENSGVMDVLGSHIDMSMTGLLTSGEQIRAGKVAALGVTSAERNPVYSHIPTFIEQGYPDVHGDTWFWLTGPKGLPPDVVEKLNQQVRLALKKPNVRTYFEQHASLAMDADVAAVNKFLANEVAYWGALAKANGLTVQ